MVLAKKSCFNEIKENVYFERIYKQLQFDYFPPALHMLFT